MATCFRTDSAITAGMRKTVCSASLIQGNPARRRRLLMMGSAAAPLSLVRRPEVVAQSQPHTFGVARASVSPASNATTREYFNEGEFVPGSPAQPYYYGPDQIGSVRRVFASASSAPAFGYDPWGNALQTSGFLTDFNYAGMFYNADSGLYLTQYRAYDPVAGRWLSRDPLGEIVSPKNLYSYVN